MELVGDGTPVNYSEALKWFRFAAAQKDARSEYKIGYMYGNGIGVPKNTVEALKWLNLAAAHGNTAAKAVIDTMTQKGEIP
jgi:TPR repeat protein